VRSSPFGESVGKLPPGPLVVTVSVRKTELEAEAISVFGEPPLASFEDGVALATTFGFTDGVVVKSTLL
jgi:hypothetical protein